MKDAHTKFARTIACLAFAGVALAACQTTDVEEMAVAEPLAPMAKPAPHSEGLVYHGIRNGEKVRNTLVSVDGTLVTWERDTDGCRWTSDTDIGYWFAPSTKWENCNTSGTTTITDTSGEMWPLEVGNTVSYEGTGQTEGGNDWSADRTCEVAAQVRITTHAGTYDTYKVVCRSKWSERISYVSPEVGATVKGLQRPLRANSNSPSVDFELTRIEESG